MFAQSPLLPVAEKLVALLAPHIARGEVGPEVSGIYADMIQAIAVERSLGKYTLTATNLKM